MDIHEMFFIIIVFLLLNYLYCKYLAPMILKDPKGKTLMAFKGYSDAVTNDPFELSVLIGSLVFGSLYLSNMLKDNKTVNSFLASAGLDSKPKHFINKMASHGMN